MSWKPECRKLLLAPIPGWELRAECPMQTLAELLLNWQLVLDGWSLHTLGQTASSFLPQ